jgi:CheY-like chemotaxis protein
MLNVPLRVLVVEDETPLARLLAVNLESVGLQVTTADSMASARAALKAESPSLLILDSTLPDGDSLSIWEEWRSRGANESAGPPFSVIAQEGTPPSLRGKGAGGRSAARESGGPLPRPLPATERGDSSGASPDGSLYLSITDSSHQTPSGRAAPFSRPAACDGRQGGVALPKRAQNIDSHPGTFLPPPASHPSEATPTFSG